MVTGRRPIRSASAPAARIEPTSTSEPQNTASSAAGRGAFSQTVASTMKKLENR